jgi:predicted ABC-type ATPase
VGDRGEKNKGKRIVIVAGPNGAGKTTFAREYLPREAGFPDFVNVDLIAEGLSPFAPDAVSLRAGRIMVAEISRRVRLGESFAFETTLAGLRYARHIPRWRKAGYRVDLFFLWLPTPDIAVARIKSRVAQGGHSVPEDVVRRRFDAGLRNFERVYRDMVDNWTLYDNAGARPKVMAVGENPWRFRRSP